MRSDRELREAKGAGDGFVHPDHPLYQWMRATRGFLFDHEQREAREALSRDRDDVVVEVSSGGVALYARDETALKRAAGRISGQRWHHLDADPLVVRTRSNPARIAWMHVSIRCPRRFASSARLELVRREGQPTNAVFQEEVALLAGRAPLDRLIGYGDWLAAQTAGRAHVHTQLAEWRPVHRAPDPSGPRAA